MRNTPLPAWYVAFVDSDCSVWWHRPLKKGFRHCFAFAPDPAAGRWLVLNPGFDAVLLRALTEDEAAAFIAELYREGAKILFARVEFARVARPRLLLTCVTAIKALLGLRGCCALSPYQLYRSLLARGAVEISG